MSLKRKVVHAVGMKGIATVDDIYPEFEPQGYTKKQVQGALHDASEHKLLKCIPQFKGKGFKSGAMPGRYMLFENYRGAKPVKLRPPASVWELAGQGDDIPWPPTFAGGRSYQLMQLMAKVD